MPPATTLFSNPSPAFVLIMMGFAVLGLAMGAIGRRKLKYLKVERDLVTHGKHWAIEKGTSDARTLEQDITNREAYWYRIMGGGLFVTVFASLMIIGAVTGTEGPGSGGAGGDLGEDSGAAQHHQAPE